MDSIIPATWDALADQWDGSLLLIIGKFATVFVLVWAFAYTANCVRRR